MNLRTPLRMSLVALVIAALLAVPALAVELETAQSVRSTQGVVTAAHPLAAAAGAEILAKGGNAVDAAIATAYALAVVEPHASNLGGEGYMVISLADGTEVAIDYRSRAPLHVNVHTPAETGWPPHGILTTLIPGMVKGTELALQKYGTMTLAEVLEPAIRLAEEGFPMGDLLASQIANAYESFLLEYPEAGKVFLDNMLIPEPGTIFRNPDLAHAMRLIAEHGSDVFYFGEIADAIEQATEGWVDKASLAAYRAYERDVVRGTYRGYEIVTAPPIVSGVRVVETLNILELFDLAQYGHPNHPTAAHIMAEALKITQADYNAYVWDPNFYRVPVEGLTSKLYARERAALISLDEAKTYEAGDPYAISPAGEVSFTPVTVEESPSTTHVSVLDKDGNAVALTQTISSFWGSRIVVPGYGFLLSNHFRQFWGFEVDDPFRPRLRRAAEDHPHGAGPDDPEEGRGSAAGHRFAGRGPHPADGGADHRQHRRLRHGPGDGHPDAQVPRVRPDAGPGGPAGRPSPPKRWRRWATGSTRTTVSWTCSSAVSTSSPWRTTAP